MLDRISRARSNDSYKVAAIVLAAGKSERMGKNKLLLKLKEKTIIETILEALEASKIDETVVVLGYKHQEIKAAMKNWLSHVRFAVNRKHSEGMISSLKKGISILKDFDAAFLILGDQPILEPGLLNTMIDRMKEQPKKVLIVTPVCKGKRGHPVLFSRILFEEILGLTRRELVRDVVHRHSDSLLTIESSEWTIMDIDTPNDFNRYAKVLGFRTS